MKFLFYPHDMVDTEKVHLDALLLPHILPHVVAAT